MITASDERDQQQAFSVPDFTPVLHLLHNPKYFEIWQYLGIMTGVSLFHLGLQSAETQTGIILTLTRNMSNIHFEQ